MHTSCYCVLDLLCIKLYTRAEIHQSSNFSILGFIGELLMRNSARRESFDSNVILSQDLSMYSGDLYNVLVQYSGDLNNKYLNNELTLVWYSDVRYSNGSSVFRPPFKYQPGIQMVV